MGSEKWQWAEQADLGGLFVVHWTVPWLDLLEEFLHTLESTKDGQIWTILYGERITIDQMLIAKQFGVSAEGVVDATNTQAKEVEVAFKNIVGLDAFVNKE